MGRPGRAGQSTAVRAVSRGLWSAVRLPIEAVDHLTAPLQPGGAVTLEMLRSACTMTMTVNDNPPLSFDALAIPMRTVPETNVVLGGWFFRASIEARALFPPASRTHADDTLADVEERNVHTALAPFCLDLHSGELYQAHRTLTGHTQITAYRCSTLGTTHVSSFVTNATGAIERAIHYKRGCPFCAAAHRGQHCACPPTMLARVLPPGRPLRATSWAGFLQCCGNSFQSWRFVPTEGFVPSPDGPVCQKIVWGVGRQTVPERCRTSYAQHTLAAVMSVPAEMQLVAVNAETPAAQRRVQCRQCGLVCSKPSNLVRHVRSVHQKARPFGCPQCSQAFAQRPNRDRHVAIVHHGRRPYQCRTCGMQFVSLYSMKRHMASQRHLHRRGED